MSVGAVKFHVSDFMADRHPYQPDAGFATQRERDAGRAFNGFDKEGLDQLLAYLPDMRVEPPQKAVALRHLLAHSAAAEKKIVLIQKNIVPAIAALCKDAPIPVVESHCAQLLRSLCVLPQGCHAVVAEGGLQALAATIFSRENAEAREEARLHALNALQLLVSSWPGRAWTLGDDAAGLKEMQLLGRVLPEGTPALEREEREALAQQVCDVLVSVLDKDHANEKMLVPALHALALLTTEHRGLQLALIAGTLRATAEVLERYTTSDLWVHTEASTGAEVVLHGAMVVWQMALDNLGQKEAVNLPFVKILGKVIGYVLPVKDRLFSLKGNLSGAVTALMLHPPMKLAAVENVTSFGGSPASLLDVVLALVVQGHDAYQPMHAARKAGQPNPTPNLRIDDVTAVIKNAVQAVRLVAELPKAREYLKVKVGPEQITLRRQLFYQTPFMQEFGVVPV